MSKLHLRTTLFAVGALMLPLVGCVEEGDHDVADTLREDTAGAEIATDDGVGGVASTDVILDADGREVGYLDAELNQRDLAGNLVTRPVNALVDDFLAQRITVWKDAGFTGYNWGYHNSSTSLIVNFTSGSASSLNNQASSLAMAAGCKASLYDGYLTGLITTVNSTQANSPTYITNLTSLSANDKIGSIKVECKTTTNTFCGYLYRDANYVGERLPVFKDYVIRFNETRFSGWNDQISSVSWNSNTTCDAIGLWEHADGSTSTTQKRRLLRTDDATLHDDSLGDTVSGVESDREVSSGEKTSAEVGEMMTAVANQRNWGKAFVCNAVDDICTNHKTALVTLTTVFGGAICRAILGAAVMEGVGAAVGIAVTGGTAAAIAVPVAALTSAQIAFGAACLTAAASSMVTIPAACDATMDTWCASYVNPTDP